MEEFITKKGDEKSEFISVNYLINTSWISDIFIDKNDNVYIADYDNNRIVKFNNDFTEFEIVAGNNGSGNNSNQLNNPQGIFVDNDGNIYIADTTTEFKMSKGASGELLLLEVMN